MSLVRTTKSLASPAAMPIKGRLARSRSPPQPNKVMTRLGDEGAGGGDGVAEGVVGVGVVDDDDEALALIDALEASGDGGALGDGGSDACSSSIPWLRGRAAGGEDVVDVDAADQRRANTLAEAAKVEGEFEAGEGGGEVEGAEVGVAVDGVANGLAARGRGKRRA